MGCIDVFLGYMQSHYLILFFFFLFFLFFFVFFVFF